VAGYPMTDVHVNVIGGDFIEESANEIAYKIAASIATRDGCRKAHPMMLEPVFSVEVVSPEEHIGDVIADLSSRRGRIEGIQQHQSTQAVEAIVPLAQMFGYVTTLRSITQGRGSYSMKFYGYDIKV
jgi:elongation factor G